ncbi:MAG: protein phosphatase 2C domain-containing protein [Simkaniaceae bacterium]|nr:protein phosphatase 2C domain-containing protein [Simkaniaceae bacterium]MCF7852884.1 protein phosphatase 2C domain-containing protein [Simkaniaceae bacterium]
MKFECFALTDIGLMRATNEDAFAVLHQEGFFALADGMGGHKAGEIASQEAIKYLCQAVQELFTTTHLTLTPAMLSKCLSDIYQNINSWVHHLGLSLEDCYGMGTTLSSALLYKNCLITSHIGDSRIYQLRGASLKKITSDHSMIDYDPTKSISRKVLTQIIGSHKKIEADTTVIDVRKNDVFLLCSDGLTDFVKETRIYGILSDNLPLENRAQRLIVEAKNNGGADNITVVILKVC